MDIDRLPDSLKPRWSRDDLMETRLGLRAWKTEPPAPTPEPGGGGTTPPSEPPPATPPETPPPVDDIKLDDLSPEEREKKTKELIADRNRKGKLQKEAEARATAAEAELDKYRKAEDERKRKEMSDLEKEQVDRKKAEETAVAEKEKREHLEREIACTRAGIDPDLADVVEAKLGKAQSADKDLDVKKWFDEQKETHPKWFGEGAPPVDTSSGPQRQGAASSEAEIVRLESELATKKKNGLLTVTQEAVLLAKIERLRLGL